MEELYQSLEKELAQIQEENQIKYANQAVNICDKYLERLRQQVLKTGFESAEEEINFFKKVKPKFLAKLLYYVWLYNLYTRKAEDTTESVRNQYHKTLKRIREFRKRHHSFYRYIKSGDTFLDEKLFMRGNSEMNRYLDPDYYCFERSFSTSFDHELAKLLANKFIVAYIQGELKVKGHPVRSSVVSQLNWTDSKVDLVELIYALHSAQSLNNGNVELSEIALVFEQVFNIELEDFYRTFSDIKSRKTSTKFLNLLRSQLIERIKEEQQNT